MFVIRFATNQKMIHFTKMKAVRKNSHSFVYVYSISPIRKFAPRLL